MSFESSKAQDTEECPERTFTPGVRLYSRTYGLVAKGDQVYQAFRGGWRSSEKAQGASEIRLRQTPRRKAGSSRPNNFKPYPWHPNSVTHPNSTSTDKGAAMLRKPSSQETPFNFRRSRPTSGLYGRKRRYPWNCPPYLLEESLGEGKCLGHCWGSVGLVPLYRLGSGLRQAGRAAVCTSRS